MSRKSQQHDYIKYLTCDITNLNEVKQAFQLIYQQHYRVDAIVNNSGYGLAGNLEALDNHTITNQFDVNLFGMINVNQVGLKYLQSKNGHIVNLGSILSQYSMPYMLAYAASKGAVLAYSKTLLSDLKYHGSKVRVNVFLPGPVKTSFQVNKDVYYSNNLTQANQAKAVLTKIENNAKKTGLNTKKVAHQIYRAIKVHSKKLIHVPG